MEDEKKWYNNIVFDFVKDTDKSSKVFSTASAFIMGAAVYMIAQGISTGFSLNNFDIATIITSVAVGFASGLGIPAVQEDGMVKGFLWFVNNNELYKRYRDENVDISDDINDIDFKREFVRKINIDNVKMLLEEETERQINNIKLDIDRVLDLILITYKKRARRKLERNVKELQARLKHLEKNGVNRNEIEYENLEVDDIFNFIDEDVKRGKQALTDESTKIQRKGNYYARIYMPILSMIIFITAQGLKEGNWLSIITSTTGFLFILIYTWYKSYNRRIELKTSHAIPSEKNRNTFLQQAKTEYPDWHKANNEPIKVQGIDSELTKEEDLI